MLPSEEPFIVSIGGKKMYICVEKSHKEYNYYGDYVKESGENALYYAKEIGRSRIYRQSYPECRYKGLKLFTYKRKDNAQKLCDLMNRMTNSFYEVREI